MPSSAYSSTISGGLKLKGGAKDAGIKKKSKSKSKTKTKSDKDTKPTSASTSTELDTPETSKPTEGEDTTVALSNERSARSREGSASDQPSGPSISTSTGKTETQRRHEEIKRKRLDERLKREGGAKTHKQRVEDLNKYLSTLSEHHDMPRIGPG